MEDDFFWADESETQHEIKKEKRIHWLPEENEQFLDFWEDHKEELRKAKRKSKIYAQLSKNFGGKYNVTEVRTKFKNMLQKYRAIEREMQKTGDYRTDWDYFHRMREIIGNSTNDEFCGLESTIFENAPCTNISTSSLSIDEDSASVSEAEPLSKRKKKRKVWLPEDTELVLNYWEEHFDEFMKVEIRTQFYANLMEEFRGKFDITEIRSKVKNLMAKYRKEKLKAVSGSSDWEYYERMKKLIGDGGGENIGLESSNFEETHTSGLPNSTLLEDDDTASISQPKKRKKLNYDEEILKNIRIQTAHIVKQTQQGEQKLALMRNLCGVFERFLQRRDESDKAFLEIFQRIAEEK